MLKQRFLVLLDYGMGRLWWWIRARSAAEIRETFAEVAVVQDAVRVAQVEAWSLEEVDIDAAVLPDALAGLRAQRDLQRLRPGYGVLADRPVVYLHRRWDGDDPAAYLLEIGADGYRTRQVEIPDVGPAIKTDDHDWPLNPPIDLYDPELAQWEIDRAEFEQAWTAARWDPDHPK